MSSKKYAILIGIEKYNDRKIAPVEYATNDVLKLGEALRDTCGFDTVERPCAGGDAEPTVLNISRHLKAAAADLKPNDLFFFHASGHGTDFGGERYLLTSENVGLPRFSPPPRMLGMRSSRRWPVAKPQLMKLRLSARCLTNALRARISRRSSTR